MLGAAGPAWPRAPARGQHRSADRSALMRWRCGHRFQDLTEKYRNRFVGMFPVTTLWSCFCSHISRASLFEATILFHALRLLTPTTSTFHHSGWPLLAVATMWLCGGSRAL